ncbi:MAG TPA: fatty acid CoA ligase family protein [Pirellulales bacterium]|nr:fatty acid CoA ligase family protein [Pirellulales bacterium]
MHHSSAIVNVAARLSDRARERPQQIAIAAPRRGMPLDRRASYNTLSFLELDQRTDRIARGLRSMGVERGTRLALFVPPSIDFVSLVFGLFKAGAVPVLIDPGMGRGNLLACLDEAQPQGFVGIPIVHAVRVVLRRRYARAQLNVTVGRRWFWGGTTLEQLIGGPWTGAELATTQANDPAAIIFTSGSTGPPKPVLYRHGNFDRQVVELRDQYRVAAGEIDLPAFPLFGLFNAAMGVTTVLPDMDPTRPARARPANIIAALNAWQVTQAFASPAVWSRVGPYCLERGIRLPSLRRVLSAGAPIDPRLLEAMQSCIADDGEIHTPYGATEALPVSTIGSREVIAETQHAWRLGRGTCVGRRFPGVDWRVIAIEDQPIATIDQARELPTGEIGELIVRGPVVTTYYERPEANKLAKIDDPHAADGPTFWHRMGDVGYFDEQQRFWFCGRKAHRVITAAGTLFTDPVEGIINQHADILRSALVGVGPRGSQQPVVIVELRRPRRDRAALIDELRQLAAQHEPARSIEHFLIHGPLPVDVRHNAKINREKLAVWAQHRLG